MHSSQLRALADLSGSFALGGLLASQASQSTLLSAASEGFASILLPKTAHAFSIRTRSAPATQKGAGTYYALDSSGRYRKVYPLELRVKSLYSQFGFNYLRLALVRALVVTYAPMLEAYFKDVQRLEKEAEENEEEMDWDRVPDFDWKEAKQRVPLVAIAMARDVVVSIVRGVLTQAAASYAHSRLVWKLVKDQTTSLRSKRRWPFYKRPIIVTRTYLRGSVISTVAEGLVGSVIECARVMRSTQIPSHQKGLLLRRRVIARCASLMVSLVTSSAAAGVVAIARPGIACVGFSLAAGFATDTFICIPAAQEYESKGRVSRQTTILLVVSSGVVFWSFAPWLIQPTSALHPSFQMRQPALAG